jgi:hypothetical protein
MNCATHAGTEATGYCRNCGKALCPECTREVRGALYCENCLAGMVGGQQPAPAPASTEPNPRLAAVLGLIPGLGAVYNGEYMKALIQVCIFAGLIAALVPSNTKFSLPSLLAAFTVTCPWMHIAWLRRVK